MTTTAFWTVLRVTSGGRLSSSLASNCLVQEMPKAEVEEASGELRRRSVKYEKSSAALNTVERESSQRGISIYACAPSERAMKGR